MKSKLFVLLLVLCGSVYLAADNCGRFFTHRNNVEVLRVVTNNDVYFSAGEEIRLQAIVQQLVRKEIQNLAGAQQQKTEVPPAPKAHHLRLHCAKCHSKNTPGGAKAGLILDGTEPIDGIVGIKALKQINTNKMPPNTQLPKDAYPALMEDILNLEYKKQ